MNRTELTAKLEQALKKKISACTTEEIYTGLLSITQEMAKERHTDTGKKKLYYISAEFLIGNAFVQQSDQLRSL